MNFGKAHRRPCPSDVSGRIWGEKSDSMFSSEMLDTEHSLHQGARDLRSSIGLAYLFLYYLLQFCGHTWIFTNMSARFLSFGCDALAGTFYFVGVVMCGCQLLSILELFHIADGLEESRLLSRFVQVMERNFLLFLIISQEEFQSQTIVCVLFYLWNMLDLLRYPYKLLRLISTPTFNMLWVRHTVFIPVYILCVIAEGVSILMALPYYESQGTYSVQLQTPVSVYVHFPYLLMAYLPLLAAGSGMTVRILLEERRQTLESWNKMMKIS
ncbi:very-long-chain (3R)-3-hydroxyacyl-CoA dehydratase 4 [Salminus brasiliensis]|uniref:very-long-chain (3R)-3-hydroxyacyl-CoA dehydratase 4 n=1 Tax=Salminus brasiliensis TaxID=930266 RepID=UPI003B83000B